MALRCDANGDFLSRVAPLPTPTLFSACLFGRLTSDTNAFQTLWQYDNGSNQYVSLATASNGTTMTLFTTSTSSTLLALTVGAWYFFAVTVGGGTATAYAALAGSPALTSVSQATGTITGLDNIRVGNNSIGTTERWDGRLLGMRIWDNVVLTEGELRRESRRIMPWRRDRLWAAVPLLNLDKGHLDHGGRGNHFSQNGTLTEEENVSLGYGATIIPAGAAFVLGV